ncbi:MAG: hypothetical protein ACLVFN_08095 [Enterocloster sp.]
MTFHRKYFPGSDRQRAKIFKYIDVCAKKALQLLSCSASPVEFMPACKEAGIRSSTRAQMQGWQPAWQENADAITIAGYEVAGHQADGIGTFVIANKAAKVAQNMAFSAGAGGVADGRPGSSTGVPQGVVWEHVL